MSTEKVKVTINEQEFEVGKGDRLIDVIREKGYGVPSFCYYKDLALQASCRMCLVRIEKMPKLQTACSTPPADGMVAGTATVNATLASNQHILAGSVTAGVATCAHTWSVKAPIDPAAAVII